MTEKATSASPQCKQLFSMFHERKKKPLFREREKEGVRGTAEIHMCPMFIYLPLQVPSIQNSNMAA